MRVGELAKLYGINRQSIYKRINKGELSKSADGLIDFSEALRVLGEPSERGVPVTELQQQVTENMTERYTLKLQVEILEKQVKKLEENERFLKEQITSIIKYFSVCLKILFLYQKSDCALVSFSIFPDSRL